MNKSTDRNRRTLLLGAAGALALGAVPGLAALAPTPRQTRGPFYPPKPPLDSDNDLVRVDGRSALAAGAAASNSDKPSTNNRMTFLLVVV